MKKNTPLITCFFIFMLFFFVSLFFYSCGGGGSSDSHGNSSSKSVTLIWDAPTINYDGTALTDLAGYKVYYGASSRDYIIFMDIGGASCKYTGGTIECSYTIENLTTGTYYFAVTAYDTEGNMSMYSNEIIKIID